MRPAALPDAWGVVQSGALKGVETPLFQAGLPPYLAYLYFLQQDAARAPRTTLVGARFLLAFVAATIPAGIVAKQRYGDILSNVDVLHGGSEALLTVSNALLALGFLQALSGDTEQRLPWRALAALGLVGGAGCALVGLGASAALPGALLNAEPANALSLQTWAIHVSSVTEYAAAIALAWDYAAFTGNPAWRGLALAQLTFLASGLTACTFHAFYNPPELYALVPLQAALTLLGNTTCAVAAWRVVRAAEDAEDAQPGPAPSEEPLDEPRVAVQLALWSVLAAAGVKYGELLFVPLEPSYPAALGLVAGGTAGWAVYVSAVRGNDALSMDRVKQFGAAGTLAYVLVELAFWAVALPAALGWYRLAEGSWLDLADPTDKARLLGAGAVFINGVRLLVPLRLGAALALAPAVERALLAAGVGDDEADA